MDSGESEEGRETYPSFLGSKETIERETKPLHITFPREENSFLKPNCPSVLFRISAVYTSSNGLLSLSKWPLSEVHLLVFPELFDFASGLLIAGLWSLSPSYQSMKHVSLQHSTTSKRKPEVIML